MTVLNALMLYTLAKQHNKKVVPRDDLAVHVLLLLADQPSFLGLTAPIGQHI